VPRARLGAVPRRVTAPGATSDKALSVNQAGSNSTSYTLMPIKGADTVGEPPSVEICLSNMPSLKAKKRGKRAPEKVLLEP
jgi:hypothetical protein